MLMDSTKRLYRSRNDRMIAGVCGGLGQFLGMDPTIIRLIFVVAVLAGFAGVLAYLILAVVIPLEP
jgi:phage shock protein C